MIKLIFLPNKFERYTAALRSVIQNLIIKNGIKQNYLKNLKTIYDFEAILSNTLSTINIEKEYYEFFAAIYLKKIKKDKKFTFFINANGNYLINRKLFTALLLNLSLNCNEITLQNKENLIIVSGDFQINSKIKIMVKKLNGAYLREIKSNKTLLVFPFNKSQNKAENFEYAYSLLQNSLSIINCYL